MLKEFEIKSRADLPKVVDQFAEPVASPSTQGLLRRSLIPDFREGVHEVVLAQKVQSKNICSLLNGYVELLQLANKMLIVIFIRRYPTRWAAGDWCARFGTASGGTRIHPTLAS